MLRPSVLVVEDNPGDRELWRVALMELGQDRAVGFAQDSLEAIATIRNRIDAGVPFALIICDYRLPQISGSELHRRLAPDLRTHGTSFIMLSGTIALSSMASADCPWYEKPLDYADFKDLVRKLMRKFAAAFLPQTALAPPISGP